MRPFSRLGHGTSCPFLSRAGPVCHLCAVASRARVPAGVAQGHCDQPSSWPFPPGKHLLHFLRGPCSMTKWLDRFRPRTSSNAHRWNIVPCIICCTRLFVYSPRATCLVPHNWARLAIWVGGAHAPFPCRIRRFLIRSLCASKRDVAPRPWSPSWLPRLPLASCLPRANHVHH